MSDPQTKAEIIEKLSHIQQGVAASVHAMTLEQYINGTSESWSADGYLKHLILSVKPFAKAVERTPELLADMFGQPEQASVSYDELVTRYKNRINEGVRAEDFSPVTPVTYRFPDGVTDEKAFLVQTWNDANSRLIAALDNWTEDDLDTHQIPHPAIGLITIREMLFFTIHHNNLHWGDIQAAGAKIPAQDA